MKTTAWIVSGYLVCALAVTSGCSSGRPATVVAEGRVTLDGKPLAGATVTFMPSKNGVTASGLTDANGDFQLTTYDKNDGAVPGEYVVTVTRYDPSEPEGTGTMTMEKYEKAAQEGALSQEMAQAIMSGGGAVPESAKSQTLRIPAAFADPAQTPVKLAVTAGGRNQFNIPLTTQ